jgi:hypothetical protein
MILNSRHNQKFCKGGKCRNAAWLREHPRVKTVRRRRPATRLAPEERRAARELAALWI